jgi:GNAT superfamily N-acetyltransferase
VVDRGGAALVVDAGGRRFGEGAVRAPGLVRAEWPDVADIPDPDLLTDEPSCSGAVYVRRVSGPEFFTLVGWLAGLVVSPERRGRGLGTSLVLLHLAWLGERGVPFAALHTEESLVSWFGRRGFQRAPNLPGPGVALVRAIGDSDRWPIRAEISYREPW